VRIIRKLWPLLAESARLSFSQVFGCRSAALAALAALCHNGHSTDLILQVAQPGADPRDNPTISWSL